MKVMRANPTLSFLSKILFLLTILLTSCESREQKNDEAFVQVKEDKFISGDSIVDNTISIQVPKKEKSLKKNEFQDEWLKFKVKIVKQIMKNEDNIKKITQSRNINSKLLKRAEGLTRDNNQLRSRLNDFEEEIRLKREEFSMEMDHDMSKLGIELTDILEKINK